MGKQRNKRHKLHISSKSKTNQKDESESHLEKTSTSLPIEPKDNIFQGIDIGSLLDTHSSKDDDTLSMKSYISNKSVKGDKMIPKKEKLKRRREMFLKKIDTVNQLKKELKLREKKRKTPIIGDTKPLLDNLPSLEHLFKTKNEDKLKVSNAKQPKRKAFDKSKKSQKKILQNITIYKKLLKNPQLSKNPFEAISGHLKAVVEEERKLLKNPK